MKPVGINPHRLQKVMQSLYSFFGVEISFQEMALSLQSASNENAVNPPLERP